MPRKAREKSNTGVYHVMLRGINKQNIFFDADDFQQMQWTLYEAQRKKHRDGSITFRECQIYAYCIMNNHVHILIREGELNISEVMKKIEDRYAYIYNMKYDRVGHLFQGRFRSEPVNDIGYFHVLLRYIHRNPVTGMECNLPEEYPYSSWKEYLCLSDVTVPVILPQSLNVVDNYFKRQELIEWVNMDVKDDCMDMDAERFVVSDSQAWDIVSGIANEVNPEDFRTCPPDFQLECLREAISKGVSINQAARLSSLSVYRIKKFIENDNKVPPQVNSEFMAHDIDLYPYLKAIDTLVEGNDRIKEKLRNVICLFKETPLLDSNEISTRLGISDSLGRKLIKILVDKDILKKDGYTKGSRYHL